MPAPLPLRLDRPVLPVEVGRGGEIIVRGSFKSTLDGSEIDASTTRWPKEAPGGDSVDASGLIDFAAGGFRVTSRDLEAREVRAVATGDDAPACAAAGVAAPCLKLRVLPLAQSRLVTMAEWSGSLHGAMTLEVVSPPAYAPAVEAASSPALQVALAAFGAVALLGIAVGMRLRHARSPTGQLTAQARRVRRKLERADGVLAAPLAPAIDATLRAVRGRRVDAESAEGRRVARILARVEGTLDESVERSREAEEQQAADELVQEVEAALEAASEARALAVGLELDRPKRER